MSWKALNYNYCYWHNDTCCGLARPCENPPLLLAAIAAKALTLHRDCRQAAESKEALDVAKAKEAAAEAKDREASSKLAGLLAREQAVADYKEQQAAALQAQEAADQVSCCAALAAAQPLLHMMELLH